MPRCFKCFLFFSLLRVICPTHLFPLDLTILLAFGRSTNHRAPHYELLPCLLLRSFFFFRSKYSSPSFQSLSAFSCNEREEISIHTKLQAVLGFCLF
jgi:hypothetical protein